MSLLDCEIYQRGRLSRVADTELIGTTDRTSSDHQVQFLVQDVLGAIKQTNKQIQNNQLL